MFSFLSHGSLELEDCQSLDVDPMGKDPWYEREVAELGDARPGLQVPWGPRMR